MEKSPNIKKDILQEIEKAQNILLHLHVKPDPDSIGSVLAMYHFLKKIGKNPIVIKGDTPFVENLAVLPGSDQIIHKNYFEIDLSKFDLFIILDSAEKNMISKMAEINFPENLKTIVIDHHITNSKYGNINLVEPGSSSTAELLFYLFEEWKVEINSEIAACLYLGIWGDTGSFRYSNTTEKTMKAVYEIVKIYPDFSKLISRLVNNNTKEKIFFDALALNSIESFFNDKVAISSVSFEKIQEKGITEADTASSIISNILISVKNWQIGVSLKEVKPNEIAISFRSKNDIDVSIIAQELGGGGHKAAAGAFLKLPIDQAKKEILLAIDKYYGEIF